jgi:hypothetical protein
MRRVIASDLSCNGGAGSCCIGIKMPFGIAPMEDRLATGGLNGGGLHKFAAASAASMMMPPPHSSSLA